MTTQVFNFDNLEHMQRLLRSNIKAGDAHGKGWQWVPAPGDHYVIAVQSPDGERMVIYGEILDPLALEHPDEVDYLREKYTKPHMKNFRFVRAFSQGCPDGELGDVHLAEVSR